MCLITPHDVSDRRKPNDGSTLTDNIQFIAGVRMRLEILGKKGKL